jgi:uncharacterized membrane protein
MDVVLMMEAYDFSRPDLAFAFSDTRPSDPGHLATGGRGGVDGTKSGGG